MPGVLQFLRGQLFQTPLLPDTDVSQSTIIITGANSGLGLDAAKHLYRMGCGTIILACRSVQRGEAAKVDILNSGTGSNKSTQSDVQVWELDMALYKSVKAFGEKASTLPRLDGAILNAGVDMTKFDLAEGLESTLTVNVTSTFLLAQLLIPTMRKSATNHNITPHISIVGSAVHFWANIKSLSDASANNNNNQILKTLSDEKTAIMKERYFLSKLIVMLCVHQLAAAVTTSSSGSSKPAIVINNVAPGYCKTQLFRHEADIGGKIALMIIGRDSEVGARTLVHGVVGGKETHGQYLSEGMVKKSSDFVNSDEGKRIGFELWREVLQISEGVVPGISGSIA